MQKIVQRRGEYGQELSLWYGDMTKVQVDAIVNAANDRLQHAGGLAAALCRAGGPGIQMESNFIGSCPTGSAVLTGAGLLPCYWIIHAVGPIGDSNPQNDQALVEAIWAALAMAHALGCRSIAIPPISTGIFGFPKRRGAELTLFVFNEFTRQHPKSSLQDVRVFTNGGETLSVFQEVFAAPPGASRPLGKKAKHGGSPPKIDHAAVEALARMAQEAPGGPGCGWCGDVGCDRCQTEEGSAEPVPAGIDATDPEWPEPADDALAAIEHLPTRTLNEMAERVEQQFRAGKTRLRHFQMDLEALRSRGVTYQSAIALIGYLISEYRGRVAQQKAEKEVPNG